MIYSNRAKQKFLKTTVISSKAESELLCVMQEHFLEIKRCKQDPLYFFSKYLKIRTHKGLESFNLYNHQEISLQSILEFKRTIIKAPRQSGMSTLMCAYALWYSLFNSDKNTLFTENNRANAQYCKTLLLMMYESLPKWLVPGLRYDNQLLIQFETGSSVKFSTCSATCARGLNLDLLLIGDAAFCKDSELEEFLYTTMPALSSLSKVIIWSTPSSTSNMFFKMFTAPKDNFTYRLSFNIYDLEWSLEKIRTLKSVYSQSTWSEEFLCNFTQK